VILMRRFVATGCLVLTSLIPVLASSTGNGGKTTAHYAVSSKGFTIGDVTTTQRNTEESGVGNIHFETKTSIKASFLWMGYHLDTLEMGTLKKGDLARYSRKGRENGTTIDIEGRLEHSGFRFDVREQGTTRTVVIPRNSYDHTTMECPEAQLDFSDKSVITLRMLDVEKMAVVKRDYHFVKNARYSVGSKEFPCRVIEFSDQNKKARRWITWDGTAVVVYRQDGKGDKNSYSVQATSVTKQE